MRIKIWIDDAPGDTIQDRLKLKNTVHAVFQALEIRTTHGGDGISIDATKYNVGAHVQFYETNTSNRDTVPA